jgi:PKD repeat protein
MVQYINIEYDCANLNITADFSINTDTVWLNGNGTAIFTNLSSNEISWLWDFGDGLSSSLENPSHAYTDAGIYSVSLNAYNYNCSDDITRSLVVMESPYDNIGENTSSEILIYPNPANNTLHINLPANIKTYVSIFDIKGKLLIKKAFSRQMAETLDVSHLSNGLYHLLITTNVHQQHKKLLILND